MKSNVDIYLAPLDSRFELLYELILFVEKPSTSPTPAPPARGCYINPDSDNFPQYPPLISNAIQSSDIFSFFYFLVDSSNNLAVTNGTDDDRNITVEKVLFL